MALVREEISENIELLIEGMPDAIVTPSQASQAALALAMHGIPAAADISAGILGGIRYATLRIGNEYYKLKYSIRVMRILTALEIYNEAIMWIDYKKQRGIFDRELADDAIKKLKTELRNL